MKLATKPVVTPGAIAKEKLVPRRIIKQVVVDTQTAIAYWGDTLQIFAANGNEISCQLLPQDISCIAWAGKLLVVALADGTVYGIDVAVAVKNP